MEPEVVIKEINKVLTDPVFASAGRSKSFLQYICQKKLQHKEEEIKEYNIAVDAFSLPPTFDQQLDPHIRVEAKRLRDRLLAYYSGPGKDDEIKISLPKGNYIPVFEKKDEKLPQLGDGNGNIARRFSLKSILLIMNKLHYNGPQKLRWIAELLDSDFTNSMYALVTTGDEYRGEFGLSFKVFALEESLELYCEVSNETCTLIWSRHFSLKLQMPRWKCYRLVHEVTTLIMQEILALFE